MKPSQIIVLQFIRDSPNQQYPLIALFGKHSRKNEKIIFGNAFEPTQRYFNQKGNIIFNKGSHVFSLYKISLIQYFFTRSTISYMNGFIPFLLEAFLRKKYTNHIIYGPTNEINQYLINLYQFIGIRYLLFAGMSWSTRQVKLGISNEKDFLNIISQDKQFNQLNLEESNEYIQKTTQELNPDSEKDYIEQQSIHIYPLQRKEVLDFLVLPQALWYFDQEHLDSIGIQYKDIYEMKQNEEIIIEGKKIQLEDLKQLATDRRFCSFLILDWLNEDDLQFFKQNNLSKVCNLLEQQIKENQQYDRDKHLELSIFHLKQNELQQETRLLFEVLKLKFNDKINITHFFIDDNQGTPKLYYPLQILQIFSKLMPKYFQINENYLKCNQFQLEYYGNQYQEHELEWRGKQNFVLQSTIQTLIQKLYQQNQQNDEQPLLKILGTHSAKANLQRSVSGYLFLFDNINILLDCGDGSLHQLYYSSHNTDEILKKIKIIFVSHFHSDHHLGLIELLQARLKLTKDPIFILLPKNLSKWYEYCFKKFIKEQFNTEDYSKYLKVIYNPETITTKESKSIWSRSKSETKDVEKIEKVESDKDVLNKILKENNLELIIRQVSHCFFSNGIVIKDLKNNRKYAYSGDRYAAENQDQQFTKEVKDCDFLIHECTFNDSQYQRAYQMQHSTFGQAIAFALKCNSKKTLLTHFSNSNMQQIKSVINLDGSINTNNLTSQLNLAKQKQSIGIILREYIQIDIKKAVQYFENNVIFAYDFMNLSYGDLDKLPELSRLLFKYVDL